MIGTLSKLDAAMEILISIFQETKDSAIADALDMLSTYREEYVKDNGQFGAGA